MTSPKKHSCTADDDTYCAEASTGSCKLQNCRKKVSMQTICYQKCYWPESFHWIHSKNPQRESILMTDLSDSSDSSHLQTPLINSKRPRRCSSRRQPKASHVAVVCSWLLYTDWIWGYRKWNYWRQITRYSSLFQLRLEDERTCSCHL